MIKLFRRQYRALEAEYEPEKEEEEPIAPRQKSSLVLRLAITACIAFVAGFLAGPYLVEIDTDRSYGLPGHCGHTIETWHLNKTFAGKPDTATEAAWRSIIPEGRGFITHPKLAPVNKDISVFHQIHCLHALRVAYFMSLHEVEKAKNSSYTDPFLERIKPGGSPEHIQHCFDYIRQALMCAADTNLEHVDPRTNETTGWGFERKCRDYWQVVRWAERWKNNGDHGIL